MARQAVSVFVNLWLKDIGIVLGVAKVSKFLAPLAAAALQHFWPQLGKAKEVRVLLQRCTRMMPA